MGYQLSQHEKEIGDVQAKLHLAIQKFMEAMFAEEPLPIDELVALSEEYTAALDAPHVYLCSSCKCEIDPKADEFTILEGNVVHSKKGQRQHYTRMIYCGCCCPLKEKS